MKNKILMIGSMILLLIMIIFVLSLGINEYKRITTDINNIDDNTIYVKTSDIAFTKEEEKALEQFDGVNAKYYNEEMMYNSLFEYKEGTSESPYSYSYDAQGIPILQGENKLTNLNYLYGHEITKENGIVINQKLAELITSEENLDCSMEDLIGKTLTQEEEYSYVIEGIYEGDSESYNQVGSYSSESFIVYEKYYSLQKAYYYIPQTKDLTQEAFEEQINEYNEEKGWRQGDRIVYNDVEVDGYTYQEVDYEKSVAKGATGLIDPQTTKYDQNLNSIVSLSVKDRSQKEAVLNELKNNNNFDVFTSDTKVGINKHIVRIICITLLLYILFSLTLYSKYISKLNYKKEILQMVGLSVIAIAIATGVVMLLSNLSLVAVIVASILTFISIMLIAGLKKLSIHFDNKH